MLSDNQIEEMVKYNCGEWDVSYYSNDAASYREGLQKAREFYKENGKWKPISTAKNKTRILVFHPLTKTVHMIYWREYKKIFGFSQWRGLPEGPKWEK